LVCTQNRLFVDALSALELSGDFGLKLLLTSQSLDNFGVNATSLISLLVKMRSQSRGASSKPAATVLNSACCAAASFLTVANASAYRLLLAKFGDDPIVCTFIIFALGESICCRIHFFVFMTYFTSPSFSLQEESLPKLSARLRRAAQSRFFRY
jgi:hypothetical protein